MVRNLKAESPKSESLISKTLKVCNFVVSPQEPLKLRHNTTESTLINESAALPKKYGKNVGLGCRKRLASV